MRSRIILRNSIILLLVAVLFPAAGTSGCGRPLDNFSPGQNDAGLDGEVDADVDAGPDAGPYINVYLEGDLTPKTFNDGLSGQTPHTYIMWIGRFELMRSESDPDPVTVFEYTTDDATANMLGRSWVGRVLAEDVPLGTYTHVRAVLVAALVEIDATLHFMGTTPGVMEIFGALSDCTIDEQTYQQNDAVFTFNAQTVSGTLPELPDTALGTVEQRDNKTWLTVELPEPLELVAQIQNDQPVTVVFEVYECFRWQDEAQPDYVDGVFDFTQTTYEPVLNFGATGYRIELR